MMQQGNRPGSLQPRAYGALPPRRGIVRKGGVTQSAGVAVYGYSGGRRTAGGGAMLALAGAMGFMLGYAVREIISRRRRAAARMTAQPELYRELDGNQTLPRLE